MKQNIVKRKIMWGDLDSIGIIFYPRYYEWMDACGHLFFESIGLSLGTLWKERNILFGLVETSCRYSSPGRYHQEIEIVTHIDILKTKTVLLRHIIRRLEDKGQMVVGHEKRICMDVSDRKKFRAVKIPQDIHEVLQRAAEADF